MARAHRPTAFEVSFPGESLAHASQDLASSPSNIPQKRKEQDSSPTRPGKRQQVQKLRVAFYTPKQGELVEDEDLIITGEDQDDGGHAEDKPIRLLSKFCIFDPKHRLEMVSLKALEEDDGLDRQFEAAGLVAAYRLNDEDEGQEDDIDSEPQYVRLGAILRYTVDYTRDDDPVWIETLHAWYILQHPSNEYRPYYRLFCTPHRIAQHVVSSAIARPAQPYDAFLDNFLNAVTLLGHSFTEEDLLDAIPDIQAALDDLPDAPTLKSTPAVRHLLRKAPAAPRTRGTRHAPHPITHLRLQTKGLLGNPDIAVLRPENQNPTHVTPLIASLTADYINEQLVVVGPPPVPPKQDVLDQQERRALVRLRKLVVKASQPKDVRCHTEHRLQRNSRWLRAVEINGEIYSIGDVVLVRIGDDGTKPMPFPDDIRDIPTTATIPDLFWFAKIISLNEEDQRAHIQWFEHASHTAVEELCDPQELFLNDLCGPIDFRCVVDKVTVHFCPNSPVPAGEFYYKFLYDKVSAKFVDIDIARHKLAAFDQPPDNCPVCLLAEQKNQEASYEVLLDGDGVAYNGQSYHVNDFVLIRVEKGPCDIGYITQLSVPRKSNSAEFPNVIVKRVGRVSNIADVLPPDMIKDERHVFMTDEETTVSLRFLIRVCYVFPYEDNPQFESWLSLSPDHFYVRYRFPSLNVESWNSRRPLPWNELNVCHSCSEEEMRRFKDTKEFLSFSKRNPLRTLDLFGGVGAFGLGMAEGSSCIKVTHTIEISPSAAKTFKKNSPETIVYNQCANTMLRYAIKSHEGHPIETPCHIYNKKPVPAPPKPGDIDALTAGFPCQSHSGLNMYRKANDPKSNLILNTLSWIDFLKPDICTFENVRGFLQFNLNAKQAGQHRLEGGIDMGGLKFLLRALLAMNYQVQYALLQAAHYGTPQTRVRFFLFAARQGIPLPDLPQPTHDFPVVDSLTIKLPIGDDIRNIRTATGTAPHPFVNIEDAIGDLPWFDWKNPQRHSESAAKQQETRERQRTIPAISCKKTSPHCGYQGPTEYRHKPKTSYQVRSRLRPTQDLQHYTKCLLPKSVERVIAIPMLAKADYRSLGPKLAEWQFANPSSSVAVAGYRPGLYGRLDKDGWFSTTVTNIDPTAKQSKVLNPYCKRIVTVRELARSQGFPDYFVFESINNNVVTMHRQIGNAVPWPVAIALGREVRHVLFKKWLAERSEVIAIDD